MALRTGISLLAALALALATACSSDGPEEGAGGSGPGGIAGGGGTGGVGGTGGNGGSGGETWATTCDRAFACDPALPNLAGLLGADAAACAAAELNQSLVDCLAAAADCGAMTECTRCLGQDDNAYCLDSACPHLLACGLGDDESQCGINCDMYTWGAAGCFYGFQRFCWVTAAAENDCGYAAEWCFDFL